MASQEAPSAWFWVISAALLLWGLGGASIYVAYFFETPDQFASTAETAKNREAYADYVANIPLWAIAAGVIAALARLLGAIALLARRAWALPLFVISTLAFLVALFRAFVIANVADVMSAAHIGVEVTFLSLSVFAVWFAQASKKKGWLR